MRRILCALALACLARPTLAQSPQATPPATIDLELPVVQRDLDNGLRVLILEDHTIPNAALYVGWRVGSRNERPGITGLAHYFEHMMFSGGARFGGGRFDPLMEAAGGSNNAYTTNDVTVYTDWFPAQRLPLLLDMEADRMRAMRFVPGLVETERGVVASERRLTVEEPIEVMREALWATAYTAHPYQWPVLGWMSDIQGWRQEDLEAFFATHYRPNHCVLVLVGDVQAEEALRAIQARMGPLERGPERPALHTPEPPQRGERRVEIEAPDAGVPQVMVGWHIPATDHPDFPVFEVLERLLLGGESSRLNRALVQQGQLCVEVGGGWQGFQFDPSLFTVELTLRPGVAPIHGEVALYQELETLRERGPAPDELEKVKRGLLLRRLDELATLDGKASLLLDTELFFGGWRKLPARLEAVQAVRGEDVQRVMQRYLGRSNRTVVSLRLEGDPTDGGAPEEAEVEQAPEQEEEGQEPAVAPAIEAPPALVSTPLRLPTPVEARLESGVRVLIVPDAELPVVTIQARVGCTTGDPAGQEGLLQVVAGSLLRGAGERDAETFQEAVEGLGGSLSAQVSPAGVELSGRFLSADADTALELLADVLRRPRLEPGEVKHELGIQLAELSALRDEPQEALPIYWRRWTFGDHPWGRPPCGDARSLQSLDPAAIAAAARLVLDPRQVWISVAGDVDPELIVPRLEQLLGDWQPASAEAPPATPTAPPAAKRDRVLLVDDPGALQTYFMWGGPLFSWRDADYPARVIARTILGGRFTSRLNTALRIESGLTYGARASVDEDRDGALSAGSYTAVATSREALELARAVYLRFVQEGITQAELDSARSYLQGQLAPDMVETPAQQADLLLDLRQAGLGEAKITGLFAALDGLTLEQVNRVITRRFPRVLSWTVIGPAKLLHPILADFGEVSQVSLVAPGFGE